MGGCNSWTIYKMVLQNNNNNWQYVWHEMVSIYALLCMMVVLHDVYRLQWQINV